MKFEEIPKGWKHLYLQAEVAANFFSVKINSINIEKGLLRINCDSNLPGYRDTIVLTLFKRICDSIVSSSAKLCMNCEGKPGLRRKLEPEWPCLCRECYISYTNRKED